MKKKNLKHMIKAINDIIKYHENNPSMLHMNFHSRCAFGKFMNGTNRNTSGSMHKIYNDYFNTSDASYSVNDIVYSRRGQIIQRLFSTYLGRHVHSNDWVKAAKKEVKQLEKSLALKKGK